MSQDGDKPDLVGEPTVEGVKPDTEEWLCVMYILLKLATRKSWYPYGFEQDMVAIIDRSKRTRGQVTVIITRDGHAKAMLINRGEVPLPSRFKSAEDAQSRLNKEFGLLVKDDPIKWELPELEKAFAALLRLPAEDRKALDGVNLLREAKSKDDTPEKMVCGNFKSGKGEDSLTIFNCAFDNDDWSFVGGKQGVASYSFLTILHEAGHAIEAKTFRDSLAAKRKVRVDAAKEMKDKWETYEEAYLEADRQITVEQIEKETKNEKAYREAVVAEQAALQALFIAVAGQELAKYDDAYADVQSAIDVRATMAPKLTSHPGPGHFRKADPMPYLVWLQTLYLRASQKVVKIDRDIEAMFVKTMVTDPQGKKSEDVERAGSQRLTNFASYVNRCNVPRKLTTYPEPSSEDFYMEAYTLWLNDPEYLKTNANMLYNWFDGNFHRSDEDLTKKECMP